MCQPRSKTNPTGHRLGWRKTGGKPRYQSNDHNRARKPPSEEGVSAQEWLSNQIASQGRLAELDMHSQECEESATVCAYQRERPGEKLSAHTKGIVGRHFRWRWNIESTYVCARQST